MRNAPRRHWETRRRERKTGRRDETGRRRR